MKLVIIGCPYAGDVERNIAYARACLRDSLLRGEAPCASHLLYTQDGVLDDLIESECQHGIHADFAWREIAQLTAVYIDFGISKGMQYGVEHAKRLNHPIEERRLYASYQFKT